MNDFFVTKDTIRKNGLPQILFYLPNLNNSGRLPLHFINLDIVRFAAAFYVLIDHIYGYMLDTYQLPSYLQLNNGAQDIVQNILPSFVPVHHFVKNGAMGVDLFFLISGFLITSLLLHEKTLREKIDIKSFYLRRILRIWPLYYFIIAFAYFFAHYFTGETFFRKDIYPHLFFVSNFTMLSANSWCVGKLFVLWSICIEEQFYLVIPLLLAFTPIKKLPYIFVFFILVSVVARMVIFRTYQYPWFPIYLHTASRFDTLVVGCLMGYMNHVGFKLPSNRWFRIFLFVWLITALSLINGFYYDTFARAVFCKYVFILPLAILFLDMVQNVLPSLTNPFWKLLNKLGKYSYGIYMYQVFLIVVADRLAGDYFSKSRWAFVFLSIAITIFAAVISYEIFEKHFLKLKKRFEKV